MAKSNSKQGLDTRDSESAKASTPPPTYNASVAGSSTTARGSSVEGGSASGPYYVGPAHPHAHPAYGPTPLGGGAGTQRTMLLPAGVIPYYDPNSAHSVLAARNRARWRFFEAFVFAFVIWTAVGLFFGVEIAWMKNERRHGHRGQ